MYEEEDKKERDGSTLSGGSHVSPPWSRGGPVQLAVNAVTPPSNVASSIPPEPPALGSYDLAALAADTALTSSSSSSITAENARSSITAENARSSITAALRTSNSDPVATVYKSALCSLSPSGKPPTNSNAIVPGGILYGFMTPALAACTSPPSSLSLSPLHLLVGASNVTGRHSSPHMFTSKTTRTRILPNQLEDKDHASTPSSVVQFTEHLLGWNVYAVDMSVYTVKVVRESSLWWWTIVGLRSGEGRSTLAVGCLRGPASPQVVLHANAHHRPASLGCDCYDGLLQQ